MGGFFAGALLQPAVELIIGLGWDGLLVDDVRQHSTGTFRLGLALLALAGAAVADAGATLFVRETGCRNVSPVARWRAEREARQRPLSVTRPGRDAGHGPNRISGLNETRSAYNSKPFAFSSLAPGQHRS